jgi:16S rRNA (cytidine1402-2'-O)-methyltransferase
VLQTLKSRDGVKGEITLLIGKAEENDARGADGHSPPVFLCGRGSKQIMAEEKVDEKAALKKVAKERGISKSEAYRELQRSK